MTGRAETRKDVHGSEKEERRRQCEMILKACVVVLVVLLIFGGFNVYTTYGPPRQDPGHFWEWSGVGLGIIGIIPASIVVASSLFRVRDTVKLVGGVVALCAAIITLIISAAKIAM